MEWFKVETGEAGGATGGGNIYIGGTGTGTGET